MEVVQAEYDAYQPAEGAPSLPELWPGAQQRTVQEGHVRAYLLHQVCHLYCNLGLLYLLRQAAFRAAIHRAFASLARLQREEEEDSEPEPAVAFKN